MPSFRVLPEPEREAIIDYVIYLSIRGQMERELIDQAYLAASDPNDLPDNPEKILVRFGEVVAGDDLQFV